jgi:D-alanyl-lipoteichoic acid acyltransferase DltB (MBOAT superfamily)
MMPQFANPASHVFSMGRITLGLLIFTIGLFKKVVLADGVAAFVGPVFDVHHTSLTMAEAWVGVLAYTFQLYFDFSGYCDMAYGLSYMFGVVLPVNFNSPYKARSIIDFWRRWHITLSSFLKDYLYVPLGGNRSGRTRRYLNLFITMLLGGLWHGANWTFIVWGALHGVYLIVNHALRHLLGTDFEGRDSRKIRGALILVSGTGLTFLSVVLAWVFFRASSMAVAMDVLKAMSQGTYALQPGNIAGVNRIMNLQSGALWVLACASIAFLTPNIYAVLERVKLVEIERRLQSHWSGIWLGFSFVIILLLLAITETRGVSEFLYFNF